MHSGGSLETHEGRTSRRQRNYAAEVTSALITGVIMRSNGMKLRKGNVNCREKLCRAHGGKGEFPILYPDGRPFILTKLVQNEQEII